MEGRVLEFSLEEQRPSQSEGPRTLPPSHYREDVFCLCLAHCQADANHLCASVSHDLTRGHFCPTTKSTCVEKGAETQFKPRPWKPRLSS